MGRVHRQNEIHSLTHLHIILSDKVSKEYKQVEIIKMKMFAIVQLAPSGDSMVDTTCAISMHSQGRSLQCTNK